MTTTSYEHDTYFPEEAFDDDIIDVDPDESEYLDGETLPTGYNRFVSQLQKEARSIVEEFEGPSAKHLSRETEAFLGDMIQAGRLAEATRDNDGEDYDRQLDERIAAGNKAKQSLVTANLPFAAYCARASMGIKSKTTARVPSTTDNYYGFERASGAIKKLSRLARPSASLEDRTQVAIEAMWKAADKFESSRDAKFITYAMWAIGRALENHVVTEKTGWDVDHNVHSKYEQALRDEYTYGTLPTIKHRSGDGDVLHDGLHPHQVFEGMNGTPLDTVTELAQEENDGFSEPSPLSIDDLVPDQGVSVEKKAIDNALAYQIGRVLDTLPEREAEIISLRFGLKGGAPMTYDEIGKICKLSPIRIRQIEKKAMSRLKHPSRNMTLKDYLSGDDDSRVSITSGARLRTPLVRGALNLRTMRTPAGLNPRTSELPTDEAIKDKSELEKWQSYKDEPWEL